LERPLPNHGGAFILCPEPRRMISLTTLYCSEDLHMLILLAQGHGLPAQTDKLLFNPLVKKEVCQKTLVFCLARNSLI